MIVKCPTCDSELTARTEQAARELYTRLQDASLIKAVTADGNDPKIYPLLNWIADRLELMRDGRVSVNDNETVINMLRFKGDLIKTALNR